MEKRVVALEVANLWAAYVNNSMAVCVNQYALQTIEDDAIRSIYDQALQLSRQHIQAITQIFRKEQFPLPKGFGEGDVNLNAPRLFSDDFWLFYLNEMSVQGLTAYALGLSTAVQLEIRQFYAQAYQHASELYHETLDLMKAKGVLDRCPKINLPESVEFPAKPGYLAGWFGEHRPLNVIEITSLYFNLRKSVLKKALVLGFGQTAQAEEVRNYMQQIFQLADKHISVFDGVLQEDYINSVVSWDSHVTDSRVPPFSDKLMMFHGGFMLQAAIAYYGTAFSSSMRRDLAAKYAAAIARDAKLAEDGMKIMMKHGWFEQPPHTVDRQELAKS